MFQRLFKAIGTFFATSFVEFGTVPWEELTPVPPTMSPVPTLLPSSPPSLFITLQPTTEEPTTLPPTTPGPTPPPTPAPTTLEPTPPPTLSPTIAPTALIVSWPWFEAVITFFSNSFAQFTNAGDDEEAQPDVAASLRASLLYVPTGEPTPQPTPLPTPNPTPAPTTLAPTTPSPTPVPTSLAPTVYVRAPGTPFSEVRFGHTLGIVGSLDSSLYGAFLYGLEYPGHCVDFCQRKEASLGVEFTGYVVYQGGRCGCLLHSVCAADDSSDDTPGVVYSSVEIEADPSCPAFEEYLPESGYAFKGLPSANAVARSTLVENNQYSSGALACQLFCDVGSFASAVFYPGMGNPIPEDNCYCLDDQMREPSMCALGRGLPVGTIYSRARKSFCGL